MGGSAPICSLAGALYRLFFGRSRDAQNGGKPFAGFALATFAGSSDERSIQSRLQRKSFAMNKRHLEGYCQRLKQLEARMQTDAQAVSEQAREPSGGQGAGELSNAPMHLGDMGTEEFLQDINATLLENEEFLVGEVREALHRIDAGTFGRCEECGQEIPRERLDALPYARFCTKCAEAAGLAGSSGRTYQPIQTVFNRPLEPVDENLIPPGLLSDLQSREEPPFPGVDQTRRDGHSGDSLAAGKRRRAEQPPSRG
jgi:RNA polymerase-binding transcription factor DksA